MPKGEIKQTIKLSGEKEYNAALKSANTSLRTLRSALKAETAELGANATAQDKNAVKTKSLQKQIAEQTKVVDTLTKAFEEAKRDYGDNQEVVAKWEQKLNNARATLAGMQNELEGLGSGVQDATKDINMGTVATRSFAESLQSVSSVAGSVADGLESIFSGVIDVVSDTVRALWDMVSDTAAKANNWTDLANYYGSTATDIQKWESSIKAAAGSFEDYIQLVNTFAYGGKEKKIEEIFGISRDNYTDMVQYTNAVIRVMKDARGEMNREQWNNAMEEIFGTKKSQKAEWFFANWENWFEQADKWNGEANAFGLNEEQIATLNDVWTQVKEIEEKWGNIKKLFASGFGEVTGTLLINVSGGLDALNAFLKADNEADRQKALDDLRSNIEGFFTTLVEAIRVGLETLRQVGEELSGSDDPLTAAVGKALVTLTNAFEWMIHNQEKVVAAVKAIAAVWLGAEMTKAAGVIAQMAANIAVIKGFNAAGGAASGAGGAAAGGAASGGGGWLSGMFAGAGAKLSGLASSISSFVQSAPLFLEAGEQIEKWGVGDTLKKWLTLGSHQTDEEAAVLEGAGATRTPEINMLRLLLDPAGTLAQFYLDMNEADTAAEDLSESAADAAEALGEVADAARANTLQGYQNEYDRMTQFLMGEYGLEEPLTALQQGAIANMFGLNMFDPENTLEDLYRLYSQISDTYTWDAESAKFVPIVDGAASAMTAMTAAANDLPGAVEGAVKAGIQATPVTVYVRMDDFAARAGSLLGGGIRYLED